VKILVVEDEHKIAHAIKKGLEQEAYIVDVCYDGTQGYDLAYSNEYDVIILDRMLPGMDGLALVKKLREENIHTPVLFLTARGQLEDKVEGLNSGSDDYLVKPFAFDELLARVRALTRRPKTPPQTILRVGDLTLSTTSFLVERGGVHISLSQKEFALLSYLLSHKNTILSKEQIISHVWNYDTNVLPNSVEVYVKHLRDKIDKPFPAKQLIKTIRGFGYKLEE